MLQPRRIPEEIITGTLQLEATGDLRAVELVNWSELERLQPLDLPCVLRLREKAARRIRAA